MREHVCCFTGHRPEKLLIHERQIKIMLKKEIQSAIAEDFTVFITGMARGVDLWAARLVLDFRRAYPQIKLICAVPYEGFEKKWSQSWQALYHEVLEASDGVKVFYSAFTYAAFEKRNHWMVNHSARVIAVYTGQRGGTYNTIQYAKAQNVQVCMIPDKPLSK